MIQAPKFSAAGREWQKFRFRELPQVSKKQAELLRRLEWMLPNVRNTGEASASVKARLEEMFEETVSLKAESAQIVTPAQLARFVGDPTFLAVLAPLPNKSRGLLECDIGLAHKAIDLLLGGTGEAVALRPLTDIEEGVMTYVIIETLKALAPSVDESIPKLRIEGVMRNLSEVGSLIGDDESLAVMQLRSSFGSQTGYIRLFVPESVLNGINPPPGAAVRRARLRSDASANAGRLSQVKTWLRAEIGDVAILPQDLAELRSGDVVMIDGVSCRADRGEAGTARLRVGYGREGYCEAELAVGDAGYQATVTAIHLGLPPPIGAPDELPEAPPADAEVEASADESADALAEQSDEAAADAGDADEPGADETGDESQVGEPDPDDDDEATSHSLIERSPRMDEQQPEGADLLNDIPLQLAVELGRVAITAEGVVGLKIGHVIDLNRPAGEPLELSVNGKVVGRGELVEIDGNLGVRILNLA